jgi:integrase
MKTDEEHKVPLSKAALAVLDRAEAFKVDDTVFPSGAGALSDAALAAVIKRMNEGDKKRWIDPASGREVVPHGFRSSFRDWAAENGVADPVAEACLAHKVSDAVVAAYKRTRFDTLRRAAHEGWSAYIERPPTDDGVVVPLLRA